MLDHPNHGVRYVAVTGAHGYPDLYAVADSSGRWHQQTFLAKELMLASLYDSSLMKTLRDEK